MNVAGNLSLLLNGQISSGTMGQGDAGDVVVQAGSLNINGAEETILTGVNSQADVGSRGNARQVIVTVTDQLTIAGADAEITSSTNSSGNAGGVIVSAGSIFITGSVTDDVGAGILSISDSNNSASVGNAGFVSVNATGSLSLSAGGRITTNTYTSGDAGKVTVSAGSLTINGSDTPNLVTGISSESESPNRASRGNAGQVAVNVGGALAISGIGRIAGSTDTAGTGGDVIVNAGSVSIEGSSPDGLAGIAALATAAGNGGDVTLNAGTVNLSGTATITASSVASNGGNLFITAANLSLFSGATINTSAAENGGSISLHVARLVYLFDSQITTAAGGNGGNITIDPQFVVLDDSLISANAARGQGGNITINTTDFLNSDSQLTATGSTNGTIDISAPDLDLSGSLNPLPTTLVSEENRLREKCARAMNHEFSSLIVVGRGGTETAPEELHPDSGIDGLTAAH